MKSLLVLLNIVILSTSTAEATQALVPPSSKTNIEAFEQQSGVVIVRGMSSIGAVKGTLGGTLSIQIIEYRDVTGAKRQQGIVVDMSGLQPLKNVRTHIDYDEIDALLKGIDTILTINRTTTKFASSQGSYSTRAGLVFSVSITSKEEVIVSVQTAAEAQGFPITSALQTVFLRTEDLATLRKLIADAKTTLDSL